MWDIARDITETVWPLLPPITIGLRFCAALLGLGLAVDMTIKRVRRRNPPK